MKKLLLLILSASLSISLSAQSLEFVNLNPGTLVSGPNTGMMDAHVQVKNIGAFSLTVKVKRTVNNLATNHISNYCFANVCYPSHISNSIGTNIDPGPVVDSAYVTLRADLNPMGTDGISEITYCAYDEANEADSICITFRFSADGVGVGEILSGSKYLSNAFPNPANHSTLVSYNLSHPKNAQIVISNMLGSAVNKILLTERSGSLELPVATLPNGVYYYTLMNDGKQIASKRLMVSHSN